MRSAGKISQLMTYYQVKNKMPNRDFKSKKRPPLMKKSMGISGKAYQNYRQDFIKVDILLLMHDEVELHEQHVMSRYFIPVPYRNNEMVFANTQHQDLCIYNQQKHSTFQNSETLNKLTRIVKVHNLEIRKDEFNFTPEA